ncbi:hypothetical protein REPUB_Repub01dG0187000 [Reevesia pubescens]
MEQNTPSGLFLISLFLFFTVVTSLSALGSSRTYTIHMDKSAMLAAFSNHHDWYMLTLSSLSSPDGFSLLHLYTYNHVMDGFSAVLSQAHLDQLHQLPGHLATYLETFGHLHTTRTPTLLGLKKHTGLWSVGGFGDDMIIGVLDTGIWPENKSFNDEGLPPVPERWLGACESGTEFNSSYCNRKLIGARSFSKGMQQEKMNISTTDDYDSPRDYMGHATDVLAGMDQAIEDGVDVLSLSLGFIETPFDENPIAIGACAALKKGIFVSCSAGNSGPHAYTIHNGVPWITTIGAGTIVRDSAAHVTLGYGELTVTGKSNDPENLFVSSVPIYFGHGNRTKELCDFYTLDPKEVAGKYLFCDFDSSSQINVNQQTFEMDRTGPSGAIFSSDDGQFFRLTDFYKPFVLLNPKDGESVKDYIINSKNATVSFSWHSHTAQSHPPRLEFGSHPINMITTVDVIENANGPIIDMTTGVAGTPLDFGAGHINPNKTLNPSLVYDIEIQDYIDYLCGLNYTRRQIRTITGTSHFTCDNANLDLNCPSFIVILNNTNTTSITFQRELTNVASGSSVYRAVVQAPSCMKAVVEPETITFAGKYSKAEFQLLWTLMSE